LTDDHHQMPTPDIAVLWKRPDGASCVLSKRGTTLFLSIQRGGQIVMEEVVESPREAIELAKLWKALPDASAP
jgi:hypothetical protein